MLIQRYYLNFLKWVCLKFQKFLLGSCGFVCLFQKKLIVGLDLIFEGNYAMPKCSCVFDESCFVSSQAEVCTGTNPF